tara:strand:+ start:183 stop:332 length:150 start_codon:yes stop_codon:yes gene_type:complete
MKSDYKKIEELVKKYPNDMMLGEAVRSYVQTKKEEIRQYKLYRLGKRSE